jgi:hypothetical protein
LTKKCNCCGEEKTLENFHSNGNYLGKKRYKPNCKKCDSKIRKSNREVLIKNYFGEWKCSRCGFEGRPIQFDCHHARGVKKFSIARATQNVTTGGAVLLKELEKCDLLCANCHRLEHEVVPIETKPFTSEPIKHDLNRIL